jgi:ribokinase
MNSPQIIVIGSFVQDLTFNCAEFPRPGQTIIGQFITGPGGKGSNQAVAAARAGGRVAYVGALGRDAFGEGAKAFHKAEGIDCLVAEKWDRPTGAAGILVNSHGQNEIVVSLGANDALTPADIDAHADVIESAAVVVSQLEANLEAEAYAMRLARESGATVVLNPAPMRPDFDFTLLADVNILIPNETEFVALINRLTHPRPSNGEDFTEQELELLPDTQLHALCRLLGVETIIVTLGERGCFISGPESSAMIPAMRGIRAVDTTGAGDAFVGAFAAALAEFGPGEIERAARFANAGAAVSVTRAGTAPAMPRRTEIDALLADQG